MAEAAHALGIGPEIEFRGRKYRLTPWTLEMTALFETWLEARAFDAVERTRGTVPEDTYQRRLDSVNRLIAAGEFAMGSVAAANAAASLHGLKYSTYLMLRYRPYLPAEPKRQRRDWVFLYESSADRDPLIARTQIEIIRGLLTNAEPDDTFAVLAAGTRVRAFADRPLPVTAENVQG